MGEDGTVQDFKIQGESFRAHDLPGESSESLRKSMGAKSPGFKQELVPRNVRRISFAEGSSPMQSSSADDDFSPRSKQDQNLSVRRQQEFSDVDDFSKVRRVRMLLPSEKLAVARESEIVLGSSRLLLFAEPSPRASVSDGNWSVYGDHQTKDGNNQNRYRYAPTEQNTKSQAELNLGDEHMHKIGDVAAIQRSKGWRSRGAVALDQTDVEGSKKSILGAEASFKSVFKSTQSSFMQRQKKDTHAFKTLNNMTRGKVHDESALLRARQSQRRRSSGFNIMSQSSKSVYLQAKNAMRESGTSNRPEDDEPQREKRTGWRVWWIFSLCFGQDGEELPDIPDYNMLGWAIDHRLRMLLMRVTQSIWFDRFFMLVALSDNLLVLLEGELNLGVRFVSDWCYAAFYTIEVILKSLAWGFVGGRLAYFNQNMFNRIDTMVAFFAWIEIVAAFFGFDFTLRSFKLFRLLQPLINFAFFAGLEAIMRTMEVRICP